MRAVLHVSAAAGLVMPGHVMPCLVVAWNGEPCGGGGDVYYPIYTVRSHLVCITWHSTRGGGVYMRDRAMCKVELQGCRGGCL